MRGASLEIMARGLVVAALTWVSAGCASDDDGTLHGAVHGTVSDGSSGKRLKGVEVAFESDTLDDASDTSDGEGRFSINVSARTPSGRLTASKAGYETRIVSVFLDDGDVNVDIELEKE
jgi:hypothetical protein